MTKILLRLALLLTPLSLWAQSAVRVDSSATAPAKNVPPGAQAPILTVPNALITVCPIVTPQCSTPTPIFSDQAMTQAIAQPLQADGQGRFGYWIPSGYYSYSVTSASGQLLGSYALSVPSPPVCVQTDSTCTINIGAKDLTAFAGGPDIGSQANAAFTSCAGRPCLIKLPPNSNYTVSTTIQVLPYYGQVLDCQGSTLNWSGTGEMITVQGQNGDSPTGAIKNCTLQMTGGNTAGTYAVHQHSRIWFSYENDTIQFFNNAGSGGILFDNDPGSNWPGYNEREHLQNVSFSGNTVGMYFHLNGGTNSYARISAQVYFDLQVGEKGIVADNGAYIYGGTWDVHANGNGGNTALVALTGGSVITGGSVALEGESLTCGVSLDATSIFVGQVDQTGPLCNAGTSDHYLIQPNFAWTYQTRPFGSGLEQANNMKWMWDSGAGLRFGLPVVTGQFGNGFFNIFSRTTSTADPEVDTQTNTSSPQNNILYCAPPSPGSGKGGGCGFGPGYGPTATTGGTRPLLASITTDSIAFHDPTLGYSPDGGATLTEGFDTSGNFDRYLVSATGPGSVSNSEMFSFRDYGTSAKSVALKCFALNGGECDFTRIKLGTGPAVGGIQGTAATSIAGIRGPFSVGDCAQMGADLSLVSSGAPCGTGGGGGGSGTVGSGTTGQFAYYNAPGTGVGGHTLVAADLPVATNTTLGAVRGDGSTITNAGGVLSAAAAPLFQTNSTSNTLQSKLNLLVPASQTKVTFASDGAGGVTLTEHQFPPVKVGFSGGLTALPVGTYSTAIYRNSFTIPMTLNNIRCYADNAGSTTMQVTNDAGTALLTTAMTCGPTSPLGTLGATTTLNAGDSFHFVFVTDGATKTVNGDVQGYF